MANKVMNVIRYYLADDFVDYIKAVGKYKNGGYYTFSSKELESWFNYCAEKKCF
jgi:adenine-specific DNA-methyltransferase